MSSFSYDFSVLGGDARQVFLAEMLAESGSSLCCYALASQPNNSIFENVPIIYEASSLEEACAHSKTVICPFPFTKDGADVSAENSSYRFSIQTLLHLLRPGQSLFAGGIPSSFKKEAAENNVAVFDYADDISLPVYNSISTAEGAICEAILHSPFNLHKSRCAVLGFGKCGHSIVCCLKGLSANVSVFTDNTEEAARASLVADESFPLSSLPDRAGNFRFIFNTIPAQFINENTLKNIDRSALIVDIASSPGGVDYDAAQRLGISALHCLGLPGKYAPASSARFLKHFIDTKLSSQSSFWK